MSVIKLGNMETFPAFATCFARFVICTHSAHVLHISYTRSICFFKTLCTFVCVLHTFFVLSVRIGYMFTFCAFCHVSCAICMAQHVILSCELYKSQARDARIMKLVLTFLTISTSSFPPASARCLTTSMCPLSQAS